MISKDKTYRTRDGREVRIYATDGGGAEPIHGAFKSPDGIWSPTSWSSDGLWQQEYNLAYDLIEVKPRHKRTVWLNVYDNEVISLFIVKEKAYSMALKGRIACIRVDLDFEEGEGL